MKLVLATRNPGKVEELRARLRGLDVDLLSAADLDDAPEVEEDARTLAGNAKKKALALHHHTGLPALADDTGLEVYALDMKPGVHSARYAGPKADDGTNRKKLLVNLNAANKKNGAADRAARFRTVLAFAQGGVVRLFEGSCEGTITEKEKGDGGFGYDAVFRPEGETKTFAEMEPDEKNAISHRGKALDRFAGYLQTKLDAAS
jgi:XTP/dITP diphosphohydrolase